MPSVNPTGNTLSGASGTGGGSGSDNGGKIRNITVNIDKLVERFEIHTATVGESTEKVKAVILETCRRIAFYPWTCPPPLFLRIPSFQRRKQCYNRA